jgi:hypothetical protein
MLGRADELDALAVVVEAAPVRDGTGAEEEVEIRDDELGLCTNDAS